MHDDPVIPDDISAALNAATPASQDDAMINNDASASSATSDASVAPAAPVAAVANNLTYTLTVGQARALFAQHERKVPAERTIQHYCIEGTIAAQKIRTSFGAEWLINEASLKNHIGHQPIVAAATAATPASQDDTMINNDASASSATSDAGVARQMQFGERRTLADVLIENAKLLATIEGKDQVLLGKDETIAELKDDRSFLRDEVRESRQQRKDVKDIASRMLEAMKTIAIAGKLPPASTNSHDVRARIIETDQSQDQWDVDNQTLR